MSRSPIPARMSEQAKRAERFRRLHRGRRPLLLPNAWDVPSARVFEEAGFPAVATSSAGMLVSLGYPDGETIPIASFVAAVGRIGRAISVPLSADIVSGFGRTPKRVAATARRFLDAGAIGVNLEDHDPLTGKLFPVLAQVEKVRALHAMGEDVGIPLVINARTDALRHAPGTTAERFDEAVRRACAFRDAGADCVYPMGLADPRGIASFVEAVQCPTNVMVRPGLPTVRELRRLGVARVSFGPSASYAALGLLKRASQEVLRRGTFHALVDGAINFDELNRLAVPRH